MNQPINGNHEQDIPPHMRPYERAARIYCERAGFDPDQTAQVPHPLMAGALVESLPYWTEVAERLMDLSMLLGCMKAAKDEQQIQVVQ